MLRRSNNSVTATSNCSLGRYGIKCLAAFEGLMPSHLENGRLLEISGAPCPVSCETASAFKGSRRPSRTRMMSSTIDSPRLAAKASKLSQ
jgi:hypothetical protein